MTKKISFIFIAFVFLISTLCFVSCANSDEVIKDGVIYKKMRYVIGEDIIDGYTVYSCTDDIEFLDLTKVTINDLPVIDIRDEAFKDKTNLKEVILPDSMTSISLFTSYFLGCTNIEKITLATDDVLNLFSDYGSSDENNTEPLPKSLKKIYLTSGCEKISVRSFRHCKYLEELHIPSTVIKIEDGTRGISIGVNGNFPNDDKFNDLPFLGCENLTIYCEATSKPSDWDNYWNNINSTDKVPIIWGA